jgi:hypothetical protein
VALSLTTVTRISRKIVREDFPGVSVNGASTADIDKSRVEVMFTSKAGDHDPARVTLNVTRVDATSFEQELRSKLTAAMESAPG